MNLMFMLAAILSGYLVGSLSFARIVVRVKTGGEVAPVDVTTPDGRGRLQAEAISATAVRLQLGASYGLLVAALDILKGFLPTLVWRLVFPSEPYFLICAAATVFGHNWPVYHRFRGGNGQSVILGNMLAIDWVGALVTNGVSMLLGFAVFRDGMLGDSGGIVLMIPWLWWRSGGDPWYIGYALAANFAFWFSYRKTVARYLALKRAGHLPTAEHAVQMLGMDYGFMRKMSRKRWAEIDELRDRTTGTTDDTAPTDTDSPGARAEGDS